MRRTFFGLLAAFVLSTTNQASAIVYDITTIITPTVVEEPALIRSLTGTLNFGPLVMHPGETINVHFLFNAPVFMPRSFLVFGSINGIGTTLPLGNGFNHFGVSGSFLSSAADFVDGILVSGAYTGAPFPNDGYAITEASFFANSVPEPATWATLLLGFAAIGVVAHRRRNRKCVIGGNRGHSIAE